MKYSTSHTKNTVHGEMTSWRGGNVEELNVGSHKYRVRGQRQLFSLTLIPTASQSCVTITYEARTILVRKVGSTISLAALRAFKRAIDCKKARKWKTFRFV